MLKISRDIYFDIQFEISMFVHYLANTYFVHYVQYFRCLTMIFIIFNHLIAKTRLNILNILTCLVMIYSHFVTKWQNSNFLKTIVWKNACSLVSLGHAGLRIESSRIRIPSHPNLIIDNDKNPISRQRLSQRSGFQCNFDLFLIKVDRFPCNFDYKID